MKHSIPASPKGVVDYLKDLCVIYRGETDNPHDVDSEVYEERMIQFLRFHLWDAERSVLENPAWWKFRILEEYGCLPSEPHHLARRIYDFAIKTKLDSIQNHGTDLWPLYRRVTG